MITPRWDEGGGKLDGTFHDKYGRFCRVSDVAAGTAARFKVDVPPSCVEFLGSFVPDGLDTRR